MDEKQVYLKAAKIIASCPKSRLPYVLKTLEAADITFNDREIRDMLSIASGKDRTSALAASRASLDMSEWIATSNPCVLKMREAYKQGLSLTTLSRRTNLNRSTLFKYLRAYIIPSPTTSALIIEALNTMFPS